MTTTETDLELSADDTEQPQGRHWELIRAALPSLHASQQRVAETLLRMSREDMARASAAGIAELAETSSATVVRTCQALGYEGFRECAAMLAFDHALRPSTTDATQPSTSAEFLVHASRTLAHLAATLDHQLVKRIATRLASANRILIAAYGWSRGAAEMFTLELSARGMNAECPADHQRRLLLASTLGTDDMALVISFTGSTEVAQRVAEVAGRTGAHVSLVSLFSNSATSELVDENLVFGSPDTTHELGIHNAGNLAQFATLQAIRMEIDRHLGVDRVGERVAASFRALIETDADKG